MPSGNPATWRPASFQGFEANREGLQVVGPGHSQPFESLFDSLVDRSESLPGCLALLLHPGLEDAQLDEGVVDPAIDLGLEFLTGLFGPAGELGLKLFRLLFGELGPPAISSRVVPLFPASGSPGQDRRRQLV